MAFDPAQSSIAYLVVGSTGTGKSSLINLFTNDKAHVGHGAAAGTTNIHMYKHMNGKDILIDTVGIEDPNGATDEEIMIQTLRFLQENHIEHVAVIWTVNPTPRASQPLQKQAKYIDSLRPKHIWDSVILIVKQSPQLDSASQGAREAAGMIDSGAANIPVITYNCTDWLTGSDLQQYQMLSAMPGSGDILKQLCYMNEKQVHKHIEDALFSLGCVVCGFGVTKKHLDKDGNEGKLDQKHEHTGQARTVVKDVKFDRHHTGRLEYFHKGCLVNSKKYIIFESWSWNEQSTYDCCGMSAGSEGCKSRWTCCGDKDDSKGCHSGKHEIKETLMSCCNLPQEIQCGRATDFWTCCKESADSKGCVEVCQLCHKPWNNSQYPGCIPITQADHECQTKE